MVDANMIIAYFWACEIFQPELPSSLTGQSKVDNDNDIEPMLGKESGPS